MLGHLKDDDDDNLKDLSLMEAIFQVNLGMAFFDSDGGLAGREELLMLLGVGGLHTGKANFPAVKMFRLWCSQHISPGSVAWIGVLTFSGSLVLVLGYSISLVLVIYITYTILTCI